MGIFSTKENALQVMITHIGTELRSRGVPEVRIPDPESTISHVMMWVDRAKMEAWIDAFAKIESIDGANKEHVVGTEPDMAAKALEATGTAVLATKDKASDAASRIFNAVKNQIIGVKS